MTTEEEYKAMNDWWAFQRRHRANIFEALFMDTEFVNDIPKIIERVALFYDLPMPVVKTTNETLAKILTSPDATKAEVFFNQHLLESNGINAVSAYELAFSHEMAHQILYRKRIGFFPNERWMQELAADMLAGIYAEVNHLPTGKYKFAISRGEASETHPNGKIRAAVVDYGRTYLEKHPTDKNYVSIVLKKLPAFIMLHYKQMSEDWKKVMYLKAHPLPPKEVKPIKIEDLPDTNLLKKELLKHRQNNKTENKDENEQ